MELLLVNRTQVIPYYQGQFDSNRKLVGSEILMRFKNHATEEAIAQLEASQQIVQLDLYAVETAIDWMQIFSGVPCSANFSGITLAAHSIVERVEELFEGNEELKYKVKIELTESQSLSRIAKNNLSRLSALGYTISLDDYGSKYNSMNRVLELPIDEIKIDRFITSNILVNSKAVKIVESILYLAEKLNVTVVAEGIESREQFELLKSLGCNCFQGYLLAKPRKFDLELNSCQLI